MLHAEGQAGMPVGRHLALEAGRESGRAAVEAESVGAVLVLERTTAGEQPAAFAFAHEA